MSQVPIDVVIARTLRAHMRAMAGLCLLTLVFVAIGSGGLALADVSSLASAPAPLQAGFSVVCVAAVLSLICAGVAGVGWLRTARHSGASREAVLDHLPATAARLAVCVRVVVAAAVVAVTVWAIADFSALLGAVIGAVLALQLATALMALRRYLSRTWHSCQ